MSPFGLCRSEPIFTDEFRSAYANEGGDSSGGRRDRCLDVL
jgi:hypothetical protein